MRPEINTNWSSRVSPWDNCMAVIQTWNWDDAQNWEDSKIWWDAWSVWTAYNTRPELTTNWN